jgi:LysM repeat protein
MPILTTAAVAAAGVPMLLGAGASGWTTYTVRSGDTLWDIASTHRTDVSTLQRANHLDGGILAVGTRLRVPGAAPAARPARPAPVSAPTTLRYTVRSGDTISAISARLRVSPALVLQLNHLDARGQIYAGQYLTVPAAPVRAAAKAAAARAAAAAWTTYRVRPGDSVSAIAVRLGTTQATLLKANRISTTSILSIGQVLRVPRQAPVATTRTSSATTFAGRTYPEATLRAADANRQQLASTAVPSLAATQQIVIATARRYGVDPALAQAIAMQESGFNQRAVSVANAIGVMQVIPSSGRWASDLTGRRLNLLDTRDNITAGVVILKALTTSASSREQAIAGYYQGLASVRSSGMAADTKGYVASVSALAGRFR